MTMAVEVKGVEQSGAVRGQLKTNDHGAVSPWSRCLTPCYRTICCSARAKQAHLYLHWVLFLSIAWGCSTCMGAAKPTPTCRRLSLLLYPSVLGSVATGPAWLGLFRQWKICIRHTNSCWRHGTRMHGLFFAQEGSTSQTCFALHPCTWGLWAAMAQISDWTSAARVGIVELSFPVRVACARWLVDAKTKWGQWVNGSMTT